LTHVRFLISASFIKLALIRQKTTKYLYNLETLLMRLRNISHFFIILTGLSGSLGFAATDQNQQPATPDGEKIYMENCAICHGDNGNANTRASGSLRPPPRNFTTLQAAMELTRDRMIHSVTFGRPGTGMMAHKDRLSKPEIAAVVDFIRGNFMQAPPSEDKKQQLAQKTEGEKIYAKNCSVCHGDDGETAIWAKSGLNPQPRNFTTAKARQELTRERMINSVTNGRPGTAMMPHKGKLSGQQIEQVVDYIRTAFMSGPVPADSGESAPSMAMAQSSGTPQGGSQSSTSRAMQGHPGMPGFSMPPSQSAESASGAAGGQRTNPHQGPHSGGMPGMTASVGPVVQADMSVPMPKGLKGDVKKGRDFYMDNCFTCHGVNGDGNGPRADFNTPRPRNFTSDASRMMLNRERLFHSITNGKVGTVMPAWGKVLNDQQIANVAEFVFTTFIQAKDAKSNRDSKQTAALDKKKAD
jgi:mono/diheme cytochrome c family protein